MFLTTINKNEIGVHNVGFRSTMARLPTAIRLPLRTRIAHEIRSLPIVNSLPTGLAGKPPSSSACMREQSRARRSLWLSCRHSPSSPPPPSGSSSSYPPHPAALLLVFPPFPIIAVNAVAIRSAATGGKRGEGARGGEERAGR